VALHIGEHGHQRPVEGLVDPRAPLGGQPRLEHAVQAEREVGAFGGIRRGALDWHLMEADPLLAAAADRIVGERVAIKVHLREFAQAMTVAGAIDRVG
jgi:hypothetical protein